MFVRNPSRYRHVSAVLIVTCIYVQVSSEDILAFADRAIDTAEDVFMHASRAFAPAEKMNLPLTPGDEPLTATKKQRLVVLGTGWGGHAISKVWKRGGGLGGGRGGEGGGGYINT